MSIASKLHLTKACPWFLAWSLAGVLVSLPMAGYGDTVTHYTYDAGDNITSITDPRGLVTRYTYDGLGQKQQQTSPDTGTTLYTYNAGRITSMTRADGTRTSYTYDALERLTQVTAANQSQQFSYDTCTSGNGRLCSAGDATGTTAYTYTPEGWISSRSFSMGQASYTLSYNYTSTGAVASIIYPDQSFLMYGYTNGVVSKVTLRRGMIMTTIANNIVYRPGDLGMASWTSSNGLVNTLSYDTDSRLTGISVPGVQSLSFGYDAGGRITQIANGIDTDMTQSLGYDSQSRLTSVTSPADNESFAYDANGNRIAQTLNGSAATWVPGATNNQLLQQLEGDVTTVRYGYDPQGNLLRTNGVTQFTYDPFNRLRQAGGATYYVNPEGQRLNKSLTSTATYFAPDRSGPLLAEGQGAPYNGPYQAGGITWSDYLWLNGRLIGRATNSGIEAIHADQTGRPEVITSASKTVVWRARNFAFDRTVTISNTTPLNLGFPGQYYDAESGLWNNGYRDYCSTCGRYVQSDPLGPAAGTNTYAYVGGNPLSYIDPFGLKYAESWAAGGAIAGGTIVAGGSVVVDVYTGGLNIAATGPEIAGGSAIGGGIGYVLGSALDWATGNTQQSTGLPLGYWPADTGAAEWGRRTGVGAREGKGRFHGIKQGCPGSKATDVFGVDPKTGDVVDPTGEVVGNLDDVKSK